MVNIIKLGALALLSTTAQAVDLYFYPIGDTWCAFAYARCVNLQENLCCVPPRFAQSAKWVDHPSSPSWYGILYRTTVDNPQCGAACNSLNGVQGQDVCLTCSLIGGGIWWDVRNAQLAQEGPVDPIGQANCTGSVEVDTAFINGQAFRVNYDVPKAESDVILELAAAGVSVQEIPERFLQYRAPEADIKELPGA